MIADVINNKKLNPVVTELFIRGRKLNISIVFITQSYFKVPKYVRINSTHFFITRIPNKRELQQIALNHSSDIDFKVFIKTYKKCTAEPYSFSVNDTTLPSLKVQKKSFRIIYNKIMTLEDQIRDEKLQYEINREAAKISALSSGETAKYEYLTGGETLPSNQQQIIEQAKFTYSPSGKAFDKQIKTIEVQGKKQIDALADLKPKEIKSKEIKPREIKPCEYSDYFLNKLAIIRRSFEPVNFYDLTYKFKDLNIPSVKFIEYKGPNASFKDIYDGNITLESVENEQKKLKVELGYIKQGNPKDKSEVQKNTIDNIKNLYNSREEVAKMFNDYARNMSGNIYDSKQEGTGLKILSRKQMLQRLPISLTQIKAGNNSQSLLN